jgi:hypothetical protein
MYLQGRLGNQLFQWAFGNYLIKEFGRNISFSKRLFRLKSYNPKKINEFALKGLISDTEFINEAWAFYSVVECRLGKRQYFSDKSNLEIMNKNISFNIVGYFQTNIYVDMVWELICEKFKQHLLFKNLFIKPKSEYLGAHIRLGDYRDDRSIRAYMGLSAPEYFVSGLNLLRETTGINKVLLMSDRPSELDSYTAAIVKNGFLFEIHKSSPIGDLIALSQSKGLVGSNSSFSWWGAYFCDRINNGQIVMPYNWLTKSDENFDISMPKKWTRIYRELL